MSCVQQPGVPVDGSIGACDVVVDLGSSDYDRRAARRESVTEFAAETLATADRLRASQVVFVSSAMVYGALPNNPVPLTEAATLRPDVEFVFARQLASAEELVEQWRLAGAAAGEVVSCDRPSRWQPVATPASPPPSCRGSGGASPKPIRRRSTSISTISPPRSCSR